MHPDAQWNYDQESVRLRYLPFVEVSQADRVHSTYTPLLLPLVRGVTADFLYWHYSHPQGS
jgi:hypothetical protein